MATKLTENVKDAAVIIARMDSGELEQLYKLYKMQCDRLRQRLLSEFKEGDYVSFITGEGERVDGQVTKINRKTVGVRDYKTGLHWRVAPALLSWNEGPDSFVH